MNKNLAAWVLPGAICSTAAFLLTGCFDTKPEFTVDPDGSGKVVHECLFQSVDLSEPKDTSESLKHAWVVVDGARTVLERRGYCGGGNSYTFTLESKRAFSARGSIVVETFDKVPVYNVPWKLENLNLLGGTAGR